MSQKQFALIEFHGDQLLTILEDGVQRVAIKPIAESLGVAWPRQYTKIMSDEVLSKGVTLTVIPSERGGQEMLTLPLDLLQGWLFKINPAKLPDPRVRARVIAYQQECYQVLHDYWVKGVAVNPRAAASIEHSDRTSRRRELPALLDRYEAEFNPEKRRILYELIVRACEAESIAPPDPDAIRPVNRIEEEAIRLLAKIEARIADGSLTNHHRREDRLAFSMRELSGIGAGVGRDLMAVLKQHPRFLANCPVNCRDGRNRHCWVFLAD